MIRRGWVALLASLAALASLLPVTASTPAAVKGDRALGEYLSRECVACHQLSGRPVGAIPAIIALPEDQFVVLMDAYRSRQRENEVMRAIAARLSDEDIASLALYFGGLKPKK